MFERLSFAALLALSACAPVVTHGPRVEPGTTVTANVGVPARECASGNACGTGLVPALGIGVRRGWVPDSARGPSFLLGLSLPIFDPGAPELDAYVQAPAPGLFAAGAGALASPHHLEPYVQAGLSRPNGDGWFATAGYAWLFADPRSYFLNASGTHMRTPPRYWAPGVGFHGHVLGRNVTAYASGALGHYVGRDLRQTEERLDTVLVRRNVRMLVIGIAGDIAPGDLLDWFLSPVTR